MRTTTNYGLNIAEGTDKYNHLTVDNPNYETIDGQMKTNEINGSPSATELRSGTVHAITRSKPDASMFHFTATSNYTAGETFTVDGVQVTALLPSGESLGSGAYIIGSEVLCCLRETLLTLFISGGVQSVASDSERLGGELPDYYGTAEDVQSANALATAANQISIANQQSISGINLDLSSGNKKFIFDYQDGKYGYNESEERGADTFHPFKSSVSLQNTNAVSNNGTLTFTSENNEFYVVCLNYSTLSVHLNYNITGEGLVSFTRTYTTGAIAGGGCSMVFYKCVKNTDTITIKISATDSAVTAAERILAIY